jgi:oligopeptide/dipeptide ABC transporter ATP-binding protein
MPMPLLSVKDLKTEFATDEGKVRAVDGISFEVDRGEVLGIVGESGSGKSVASLSLMRLIPTPPGRIVSGEVLLHRDGETLSLLDLPERAMRRIRGRRMAMIFQDPMTSLNPYLRISEQLVEVLTTHQASSAAEARRLAIETLDAVGIPDPARRFFAYPHELSGGMRQRVMIAMGLLCKPDLLIADEPTTALDVTIQAQILDLLDARRKALGLAIILITHDLGVIARLADRVAVMYAGRIVEQGPVARVLSHPHHPYTVGLKRSIPSITGPRTDRLTPIAGLPPSLADVPSGCAFHPRCPNAMDRCRTEAPEERSPEPGHLVRCHETDRAKILGAG